MGDNIPTFRKQLSAERKIAAGDFNNLYSIAFALSEICTRGVNLTGKASFKDIRSRLNESLKIEDDAIGPFLDVVNKESAKERVYDDELNAALVTLEAGNAVVKKAIIVEGQKLTKHLPADMAEDKETVETAVWWAKRLGPERVGLKHGQNPTLDPKRAP